MRELKANIIERWFLKRIIRKNVMQGSHYDRILSLYNLIISACREEFTEDNKPTLDGFLSEIHQSALERDNYNKYKTGL
tara:strand:+ start:1404 stop:1640 length:237 start_codon:yes stop_codon:yes gene_type:complete